MEQDPGLNAQPKIRLPKCRWLSQLRIMSITGSSELPDVDASVSLIKSTAQSEAIDWNERTRVEIERRMREHRAALTPPEGSVLIGASNVPQNEVQWVLDWRAALPEGHPVRVQAETDGTMRTCDNLQSDRSVAIHESVRDALIPSDY